MEVAWLYGNMDKYAYYFIDLLVGSPQPQRTSVIVDTGSRLVGFPCTGCSHCGEHLDPAFDVGRSDSARWLGCEGCMGTCQNSRCGYEETYSEGSTISGVFFGDLVRLGDAERRYPPVRVRMGCHSHENKLFYTQRANGIMGLAPSSSPSLNSALPTPMPGGLTVNVSEPTILQDLFRDHKHVRASIFSICLATWGGRLTVGGFDTEYHDQAAPIAWMPMRAAHYYFVFPESLSLGSGQEEPLDFGLAIVDSGTTYTYLPAPVYAALGSELTRACSGRRCGAQVARDNCWQLDGGQGARPDRFPTVHFRFKGGGRVAWHPTGYLQARDNLGLWCPTFKENNIYQTVLGISWMIHKDVVFDIQANRIGVATAKCPEHHVGTDYLERDEMESVTFPAFLRGSGSIARVEPVVAAAALVTASMTILACWAAVSRATIQRGRHGSLFPCLVPAVIASAGCRGAEAGKYEHVAPGGKGPDVWPVAK